MITLNFSAVKNRTHWVRFVYMLLFACVIWWLVPRVILALSLLQFLYISFISKTSDPIQKASNILCAFTYQAILFITYNSDQIPFPFTGWPNQ